MDGAEKSEKDEKESPPLQIDPKWCVQHHPSFVLLTADWASSIQDALRSFFQPIKTDDPRLDFYAMYKREATEYDMDYIKKYDEDLNTTLIFVRRPQPPLFSIISPVPVGRSVLSSQLRLRHRRPFQPPTQSERAVCRPPPCNPPHSQSVRHPW